MQLRYGLFFILFSFLLSFAQDENNGVWRKYSTTVFNWETLSSSNIFPAGDQDDVETTQALGFNFNYYGNTFNTITVTDNGLIAFGDKTATIDPTNTLWKNNQTFSSTGTDVLGVFWEDARLVSTNGALVRYQIFGSSPYRYGVLSFENMNWSIIGGADATTTFSIQVKIY